MMIVLVVFILYFSCLFPAHAAESETFLPIQEITTESGITAWLVEDHTLPVISLQFAFAEAGAANDPPDKQGLSQMLSNTLDEGAGDYDSQAFQKALTDHSISLSFASGQDDFTGSLKTLTRHQDLAFDLLRQALTAPHFDPEAVERMRQADLARLRSSLSDPDWIAARIMNDVAFAGHPYALNSGGTLTTLQNITPDNLRQAAKNRLNRGTLVVSVAGDITAEGLKTRLDEVFGELPVIVYDRYLPMSAVQNPGTITLYAQDIPQTIIQIMQPGIGRADPDYYPALLMDHILGGGGFGSRLTEEIREKRGLTYGIHTGFYALDFVKAYSLSTSTKNESAAEVLDLIRAEIREMQTAPVTKKELEAAKTYLIGAMPLALSSTDRIAGLLLGLRLDNLPIDWLDRRAAAIASVTAEDIQRVAKKILQPDGLTVVMVGQPAGVTPDKIVETLPNVE